MVYYILHILQELNTYLLVLISAVVHAADVVLLVVPCVVLVVPLVALHADLAAPQQPDVTILDMNCTFVPADVF